MLGIDAYIQTKRKDDILNNRRQLCGIGPVGEILPCNPLADLVFCDEQARRCIPSALTARFFVAISMGRTNDLCLPKGLGWVLKPTTLIDASLKGGVEAETVLSEVSPKVVQLREMVLC